MKKILLLIITLLLVGCTSKINVESTFVYLIDPTKDSEFNNYIRETIDSFEDIEVVETENVQDYISKTASLSNNSCDLIISTASIIELSKENGINNRRQKIASVSNYFETKNLNESIYQVSYKVNNAGFLAGVASGYYSLTNGKRQVGFIINDDSKINSELLAGFEDGVWQEYPECDIYVGSTLNGESISEILDKMSENGVSIIFASIADGDTSIIEEVKKKNTSKENFYLTVYDTCPRDIGGYYKMVEKNEGSSDYGIEPKNSIYFRVYNDAYKMFDYIQNNFDYLKTDNSFIVPFEAPFVTEVLNNYENVNKEQLNSKIDEYKNLINSHEIVVRSSPSNANTESRVKIVD